MNLDEKSGWVVRLKIRKRTDSKLEYVYLEYNRNGLSDCPYPFRNGDYKTDLSLSFMVMRKFFRMSAASDLVSRLTSGVGVQPQALRWLP